MFGFFPGIGLGNALIAPPGTSIPMAQAAAPAGWTSSAVTDTSFRYNSGTGGGSGGSIAWSSWNFGGTFGVNTFTLSVAQLAAHNHPATDSGHIHTSPGHLHQSATGFGFWTNAAGQSLNFPGGSNSIQNESTTNAVAVTINTDFANVTTSNTGSGAGISPTYTTPQVKYVDHILAVKS
jgi:hypothetical protein